MFFLLKKIKNWIQGSVLDRILRRSMNIISPLYYKNVNKEKNIFFEKFVIILYGGMGDCLLMFPLIKKINTIRSANIQKCISWCIKNKIPYNKTTNSGNIFMTNRKLKQSV